MENKLNTEENLQDQATNKKKDLFLTDYMRLSLNSNERKSCLISMRKRLRTSTYRNALLNQK